MSGYNPRRAPNVSQYLQNLNTIPSPQDHLAQQAELSLADDGLDFLTNAEFFDFDQFNPNAAGFPQNDIVAKAETPFQFGDFGAFPPTAVTSPSTISSPHNGLQGAYPPQPHHFPGATTPSTGDKRKASIAGVPAPEHLEESSRVAAEEDKRRRNTAASARFRVKKKQREQALEKQTKDMADKVSALEGKVQQLEMENKWLKELITEKSDTKTLEAALEARMKKETTERSSGNRTDGVGTD
ncbi:unnamed protein product [Zymoseptoria tritici ST99CH_1A5]|uniref:BZIP domain-containing protein n=2 Tax=Zymoseptoria tritici TaxID=1047171 RepID=A0A2H1H505_ZYMTR|nr:unnamed protein product [Zymoseptoria tritici ST99CH_1E4]SMR64010.1 unnamed protein product [Zymoseptoria tritici ST99CH_3D1]SMY29361.1 unnamed protein product [Zymoseptoria tritici ST99CH_1A5]